MVWKVCLGVLVLVGCAEELEPEVSALDALFGNGSHDVSGSLRVVVDKKLNHPQDLAFNPDVPDELWVVNRGNHSVTIVDNPDSDSAESEKIVDPYAIHFMANVSSIAFGKPGHFATCQDSRNTFDGLSDGDEFMGPTLWPSDRSIFGESNPKAVEYLTALYGMYTDLGSHLDMLHESPNCMGVAWEKKNQYWVFDGFHNSINFNNFHADHGLGYDDHDDGVIERWVEGEVKRKRGVVSHLVFDDRTSLLYIADTGNNRIKVLDTTTGSKCDALPSAEPAVEHHAWCDAELTTLVDGDELGMSAPAGIELVEDMLYVTDNGTSRIHRFDLEGNQLDWAETGLPEGSLAGITAKSTTDLWLVDQEGDQVLRLVE